LERHFANEFLAVALWHCVVRLHEPSGRCLQIVHLRRSLVLVDLQLGGMSGGAEGARDGKKGGARRLHHCCSALLGCDMEKRK